jgi:hypothetical protein
LSECKEAELKGDTIFILRHEYELDGYDMLKILGVYSERVLAEQAQARFETEPGFCEHKDGFVIEESQIDKDLWSEGFITYRYPLTDV